MTSVLLVDNYDSFTYNLAQAMGALGAVVDVVRADDPRLQAAIDARPDRLVISPGPGRPEAAGRSPSLVRGPRARNPDAWRLPRPAVRRDRVRRARGAGARAAPRQDIFRAPRR